MSQTTKSQVTLKGSAQMVAEFFNYGINSILYQRGIYPPGIFTIFKKSFSPLLQVLNSVELNSRIIDYCSMESNKRPERL